METPKWDKAAEGAMRSVGHGTDPSQVRKYDEEIRLMEYQDEDGKTKFAALPADSEADGPYVSKPFNPNHN